MNEHASLGQHFLDFISYPNQTGTLARDFRELVENYCAQNEQDMKAIPIPFAADSINNNSLGPELPTHLYESTHMGVQKTIGKILRHMMRKHLEKMNRDYMRKLHLIADGRYKN